MKRLKQEICKVENGITLYKCIKCNNYLEETKFMNTFKEKGSYKCKECRNSESRIREKPKAMLIIDNNIKKYLCCRCKTYHSKDNMYLCDSGIKKRWVSCKTCAKWRAKEYLNNNTEKHLLSNAKKRAKKLNLKFNLELSDIIIPKKCPLLNIPIKIGGIKNNCPSVDRINNSKGYIKGNIRVISFLANSVKRDLNKKLLINFSKNIIDYMT